MCGCTVPCGRRVGITGPPGGKRLIVVGAIVLCIICSRRQRGCDACFFGPSQFVQNAELFTLTYGSIVLQLIKDYEDINEVNVQLEKMYVDVTRREQWGLFLYEVSHLF